MIDSSIGIPEGIIFIVLIFGFGYMLSRKHSIQAVIERVIFDDRQLFNNELVPRKDMNTQCEMCGQSMPYVHGICDNCSERLSK
jgi:hypothetical protein